MITHGNLRAIEWAIARNFAWLLANFMWDKKRRLKDFNQAGVLGILSPGERAG